MIQCKDVYNLVDNPQKIYQELDVLRSGLMGDYAVVIAPVTFNQLKVADASGVVKTVEFDLVNTRGYLHDWYTGDMTVMATASSIGGTVSISSTNLVNGKIAVVVTLEGTWLENDTFTLTITPPTIKGIVATVAVDTDITTIIA